MGVGWGVVQIFVNEMVPGSAQRCRKIGKIGRGRGQSRSVHGRAEHMKIGID